MSRASWVLSLAILGGCGGCDDPSSGGPDGPPADTKPDMQMSTCKPLPVMGQFMRRPGNPRLLPGVVFPDGKMSLAVSDPDVRWDPIAARYELFYGAPHATAFGDPAESMIRRATSPDRMTWTVAEAPALRAPAATATDAWDRLELGAPTVVHNPAAPADRRYLMLYRGAARTFPFPGYTMPEYAIGAAFSADGLTFTRITAAQSPHGKEGLVLTGAQAYAGATGAIVSDPELAYADGLYHAWFSSFACDGAACANVTDRGVAHATSPDGITWTVLEAPVRSLLRASQDRRSGGGQPSVVYDAEHCRWELWLSSDLDADVSAQPVALDNTRGVFPAESFDARNWSIRYDRPRDVAWAVAENGEGLGLRAGGDVAQNASGRLMIYVGYDDQLVPNGFTLPDRATGMPRPGVTTLNVATRDLP